ncbi:MAG: sulfurtransferase [Gammaproteobacteria bacterium]|nr:sulfurtransferase [Gammaproteobacteria bacterium]
MLQITAPELKTLLDEEDAQYMLLDVREPYEFAICNIKGSVLMPMRMIPEQRKTLDPDREIVVICHHGIRSAHVIEYLQSHGFKHLINLEGGIEQWRQMVDPSMPAY